VDLHTVEEVVDARAYGQWRPGDAWLAGGTWLFSEPQPHLRRLLDLADVGWPALVEHPDGGLEIAATCTIAELARHPHPLFGQCARAFLASFKIWNVATVGGNLCNALPAGPMISLTAALDGVCLLVATDGTARTLPVAELVTGAGTTALRPGELLRSITLPAEVLARPSAFRQISVQQLGRSAVLVIGTRGPGGVELTVTASTPRPVRVAPGASADVGPWFDDVHGDPAWRRHMTLRFAEEIRAELES
jgi:CO/xanthine dehydrogenase FAD-binding subunit